MADRSGTDRCQPLGADMLKRPLTPLWLGSMFPVVRPCDLPAARGARRCSRGVGRGALTAFFWAGLVRIALVHPCDVDYQLGVPYLG